MVKQEEKRGVDASPLPGADLASTRFAAFPVTDCLRRGSNFAFGSLLLVERIPPQSAAFEASKENGNQTTGIARMPARVARMCSGTCQIWIDARGPREFETTARW